MLCSYCGTNVAETTLVCPECGQKFQNSQVQIYNINPDFYNYQDKVVPQPSACKKFFGVLLCIIASVFLFCSVLVFGIRKCVSKESIQSFNHQLIKGKSYTMSNDNNDLSNAFRVFSGIEVNEDTRIIEEFSALILSQYMLCFLDGDNGIDENVIIDWVQNNEKEIEKVAKITVDDSFYMELKDGIRDANKTIEEDLDDFDSDLIALRKIVSKTYLKIYVVITVSLFILVALIFGKRVDKSIVYCGTTSIVSNSVILGLVGLVILFLKATEQPNIVKLYGYYIYNLAKPAILMFILGFIFVIFGKVIRKKNKTEE